jgi:hypothetical protein
VRVWDVSANKMVAEHHHQGAVRGASWDHESKRVLSLSADGTVRILDLRVTPWVALPSGTPGVDLAVQVEAHTGMRLDEAGRLVPLSRLEWLQRKERFAELKAQAP